MQQLVKRIHDIGAHAWLLLLQRLNALAGIVLGGVALLSTVRPQLAIELTSKLTPAQQVIAGIAWCSLVHYALRRAKKAGDE